MSIAMSSKISLIETLYFEKKQMRYHYNIGCIYVMHTCSYNIMFIHFSILFRASSMSFKNLFHNGGCHA